MSSGYSRTVDFVQYLFKRYAQLGLSEKSDRAFAISGLMERMGEVFRTENKFGIFATLRFRLLLWRRLVETNSSTPDITYHQHVPSWSWMTYSGIDFLEIGTLYVPGNGFRFHPVQQKALCVQVMEFPDCSLRSSGGKYDIMDADNVVGLLWFDANTETDNPFLYCAVVGTEANEGQDSERKCFILVLENISTGNSYRRIGVGEIKAHYVFEMSWEGKLF